ncbi:1,4-alpha-glucan branching protein GlgB [Citricoccus sp. SGAir0253]|uniref:1,4-alpha-glucan branching protein GlgB n=1 Tax=Citricoccus sp. SGAir0253 TaxID=2567881 RepID=UPI0010CCF801|nr:1,4-alpha-glucan branching protein GlgB [Citricoccus sp. SGAir0253]QCU78805.1 1,4-alpha-glucan branching protein GlgB [Citricoccus sp. SGAir0253]
MTTEPNTATTLPALLEGWLPSQRWFPLTGDFTLDRVGGIRLSGTTAGVRPQLHVITAARDGETVTLSVPLAVREDELEEGASALVGRWDSPDGPRWVYDGARDPEFVAAWLEMMRRELPTADGRSGGHAYAGFGDWPAFEAGTLRARMLEGEQSNTSVVIEAGPGTLILKFFRVLAAGANPDVEIGLALSGAGSSEVPVTYGSVTAGWRAPGAPGGTPAEDTADGWVSGQACVLREFITGSRDAWRVATESAAAGTDFTGEAAGIGAATGRLHLALAETLGTRQAPAGPSGTPGVLEELAGRIEWGWRQAAATVGEDHAGRVREVLDSLRSPEAAAALPPLQRIHADYHLGQVLASAQDGTTRWTVLDFEGEPLREAGERSGWDLPLRDVVGMLRSFDYAGALAGAPEWTARTQEAFLEGYGRTVGAPVDTASTVFTALLLDKALYETAYELRHRPDWVEVPASAVRRALGRGTAGTDGAAAEAGAPVATGPSPDTVGAVTEREPEEDPMDAENMEPTLQAGPAGDPAPAPLEVHAEVLDAVAHGRYHQPHEVLGAHLDGDDTVTFRVLRPLAEEVSVRLDDGTEVPLRHEHEGVWVGTARATQPGHVPGYRILVSLPGADPAEQDDPYRYLPTLGELDQHLFREGRHETLWTALGSRVRRYSSPQGEITGTSFAVWAPNARAVRVKGDFNGWDGRQHAMRSLGDSGLWEIFVPGIGAGTVYKYAILGQDGHWRDRADPMARWTEVPPATGSRVDDSRYVFGDQEWMERRARTNPHDGPMSVYEVHAGSWRPGLGYREMADQLVEYVSWQGFTHVEFLPLAEHPFGGSWGYQVTGYYAPTSRFGTPDDFKYLVDRLHQAGIGVLLDWVPAHFPKDEWALAKFDGTPLYEYADPRKGEHPDWGTLVFDYGRTEVRNFLVANALYWLEEFHVDGLRVDAVASMLYLDYSRKDGEWVPNVHGGNHNLEAISFLKEATATAYKRNPGIVMVAEESTAFSGVTASTENDGLGFGLKWNMGWMHDSLAYMSEDPVNRRWHHNEMTFSLVYAWSENYVLPLSHDEVVHGKGSLLRKMPGDRWQELASLRAYYGYMWAHPGKQLLFMGSEFGQESEWKESHGLDWWLTDNPQHKGLMKAVRDLNRVYRDAPELWSRDNDPAGFQWIDQNDGDRNLFSFIRWSDPEQTGGERRPLVCVSNFAGTPHHDVQLGLPLAGEWEEVLNTDSETYGGSGVGNAGTITAVEESWHGQPATARVVVPPLATVYFRPVR